MKHSGTEEGRTACAETAQIFKAALVNSTVSREFSDDGFGRLSPGAHLELKISRAESKLLAELVRETLQHKKSETFALLCRTLVDGAQAERQKQASQCIRWILLGGENVALDLLTSIEKNVDQIGNWPERPKLALNHRYLASVRATPNTCDHVVDESAVIGRNKSFHRAPISCGTKDNANNGQPNGPNDSHLFGASFAVCDRLGMGHLFSHESALPLDLPTDTRDCNQSCNKRLPILEGLEQTQQLVVKDGNCLDGGNLENEHRPGGQRIAFPTHIEKLSRATTYSKRRAA